MTQTWEIEVSDTKPLWSTVTPTQTYRFKPGTYLTNDEVLAAVVAAERGRYGVYIKVVGDVELPEASPPVTVEENASEEPTGPMTLADLPGGDLPATCDFCGRVYKDLAKHVAKQHAEEVLTRDETTEETDETVETDSEVKAAGEAIPAEPDDVDPFLGPLGRGAFQPAPAEELPAGDGESTVVPEGFAE